MERFFVICCGLAILTVGALVVPSVSGNTVVCNGTLPNGDFENSKLRNY